MNGFPEGYDETFNKRVSIYFGDPVAREVEWTSVGIRGGNFKAYTLNKVASRYIIKWSIQNKIMFIIVYIFSFVLVYVAFYQHAKNSLSLAFVFFAAALLMLLGITYKLFLMNVKTFDADSKMFWEKKTFKGVTVQIPFEKMHAIQIIPVVSSSGDCGDDITFEMNLVLHDGSRLFIMELHELNDTRNAAETLSPYIGGIPIWDITQRTANEAVS